MPVTKEQTDFMAEQFREGKTTQEIGRMLHVSRTTVRKYLRSMGFEISNTRPLSDEEEDKIRALYNSGLNFAQIASEVGRSRSAVTHILYRRGIAQPRKASEPEPEISEEKTKWPVYYEIIVDGTSYGFASERVRDHVYSRLLAKGVPVLKSARGFAGTLHDQSYEILISTLTNNPK